MKIAIINMYAKMGSTGSIAYHLGEYLRKNGHETFAIYGRENTLKDYPSSLHNQSKVEEKLHGILSTLTGLQGYFSDFGTTRMLKALDQFKPDAVVLINIHSGYLHEERLWKYLARHRIKTTYILADEYAMLGNCCFAYECKEYETGCHKCPDIHRYPDSKFFDVAHKVVEMKKRCYDEMGDLLTFVAPNINIQKAKNSYLLKGRKLEVANWGISPEQYGPTDPELARKEFSLPEGKRIILSVASFIDPRKGISTHFLDCAKETKEKDLLFVNVGYDGKDEKLPDNFVGIPYVRDKNLLASLVTLADLVVMPSRGETLPVTCLISLSCGTPLCLFDSWGGLAIGEGEHLKLVEAGNTKQLMSVIEQTKKKTEEIQTICRNYVRHNFDEEAFYQRVMELTQGGER